MAASTYIPEVGCRSGFALPYNMDEILRPDDGVLDALVARLGGGFDISKREHPAQPGHGIPDRLISNGTFGRPTSWRQTGPVRITWHDIYAELRRLKYEPDGKHYLWFKTQTTNHGRDEILPATYRLRGTLVIFRVLADLTGYDFSANDGGQLDPDYHRAGGWARQAAAKGKDFVEISDLCQTKTWGNVGHNSVAVNAVGLTKLEVHAVIPAYHREWAAGRLTTSPSLEETAWRRGLIHSVWPTGEALVAA